MRLIPYSFTTHLHKIHLDSLNRLVKGHKNADKLIDNLEDIFALMLTKGFNMISRSDIKTMVRDEYVDSTDSYDIIKNQIKNYEFREFLSRVTKLKSFKHMVEEPAKSSEALASLLYSIKTKKTTLDNTNKGKTPMKSAENLDSANLPNTHGFEELGKATEDINNTGSEITKSDIQDITEALKEIDDFTEALPFANNALELVDEDISTGGKGHGSLDDTTLWLDKIQYFINNYDHSTASIDKIAHNLDTNIKQKKSSTETNYKATSEEPENLDITKGRSITKATPMEMAQDDDVFFDKFAKSNITQREYQEHTEGRQCLYILCDSSGSMMGIRHNMAMASVISLCRKSADEGNILFFRFFDDKVFSRQDAITPGLHKKLEYKLFTESLSCGGTNIVDALDVAIKDIKEFKETEEDINKAEILLITDGEDSNLSHFDVKGMRKEGIKLHSVLINSSGYDNVYEGRDLKNISDTYNVASTSSNGALTITEIMD